MHIRAYSSSRGVRANHERASFFLPVISEEGPHPGRNWEAVKFTVSSVVVVQPDFCEFTTIEDVHATLQDVHILRLESESDRASSMNAKAIEKATEQHRRSIR